MSKLRFVLCLLCLCCLCGCGSVEPADAENGYYYAGEPSSALEYNLFLSKHLSIVSGQLTTRMVAIQNSSHSVSSTELSVAEENYQTLLEEINIIKATQPAKTYDSSRSSVLTTLDVVRQHYEDYINDLKAGKDIAKYAGIFQNDFNSVTGLYNLYNN